MLMISDIKIMSLTFNVKVMLEFFENQYDSDAGQHFISAIRVFKNLTNCLLHIPLMALAVKIMLLLEQNITLILVNIQSMLRKL
jgi:hypothetical protein